MTKCARFRPTAITSARRNYCAKSFPAFTAYRRPWPVSFRRMARGCGARWCGISARNGSRLAILHSMVRARRAAISSTPEISRTRPAHPRGTRKMPAQGEIYNLATGREVTISELAHLLLHALDAEAKPAFDGHATPGNPLRWCADISWRICGARLRRRRSPLESVRIDAVAQWAKEEITAGP